MRLHAPMKHAVPALATSGQERIHEEAASKSHFLHASKVFVSTKSESIVLILGSCVGVCIWDEVNRIGGATHYLLPSWDGTGTASPRYGNVAISILVQKLLEAGANRGQLQAKVFGGGCLFDSLRTSRSSQEQQHLGSRNVEIALETLSKAQIPVISAMVSENRGQRIVFRTANGEAEVMAL